MSSSSVLVSQARSRNPVTHRSGFWVVAVSFFLTMAFATIPTPLYALYQRVDHFPTFTLTIIFAAYVVGVGVSLVFVGHLSDAHGRKRLIVLALVLALVSAVIFIFKTDVAWLLVARFISGLAVGALTTAATAFLTELEIENNKLGRIGRKATVMAGVVNLGGLGTGALVSGFMADTVSAPLVVPYIVFAVLFVLALLAVLLVPETVERSQPAPKYRPQSIRAPKERPGDFRAAATASFAVFAVLGLFTSVAPTFLALSFGVTDRFLAGGATFVVFGGAAIAQVVFAKRSLVFHGRWGVICIAAGLVLLAVAALTVAAWLFIAASGLTGVGIGLLFRAALGTAAALSPAKERGGILATLFLISYIGMVVPVLVTGAVLLVLPATPVLVGFVVVVTTLALWAGRRLVRSIPAAAH